MKQSWVQDFYHECGREISLSLTNLHTISSWTITAGIGLISALVLLGDFPNVASYGLLALGAILLLRFFVRSLLAYDNLERWNRLQRAALTYLQDSTSGNLNNLQSLIESLYRRWRSPLSRWELIRANAVLTGSGYVLLAVLSIFVYAAVALRREWEAQLITVGALAVLIWELYWLVNSHHFTMESTGTKFGPEKTTASKMRRVAVPLLALTVFLAATAIVWQNGSAVRSAIDQALDRETPAPSPKATAIETGVPKP